MKLTTRYFSVPLSFFNCVIVSMIVAVLPLKALSKTMSRNQASEFESSSKGRFGLGIELGDPTAITGKYWLEADRALDFGASFFSSQYLLAYGDYLFQFPGGFGRSTRFVSQLNPYIGVGGLIVFFSSDYYSDGRYYRARNTSATGLGIRVPLGIEWQPSRPPLGVFVQIVPGILILPGTSGLVEASVGIRYYF